jgi:pilus assembly protein FimV
MNRSLKLSMLIALALGSSQAIALDLGQIQVKSALGQPLLAEIPLHPATPAELQNLTIQLASSEEFARAGIVGGRTTIPLHFSVANAAGGKVIRITSSEAVDDPYLDLLLEMNSNAGKSVREFAILLDPPSTTAAAPAAVEPRTVAPAPSAQPRPAHARPAQTPPAQAHVAATPRAAAGVSNGQYGPVQRGQTLSSIARSSTPAGVDTQQMMLALKQANPDAFYRDNINALKSGAILRVPTTTEAQAMTVAAAMAEVRRQNSDWRAGVPGKPAVVADTATRATASSAPSGSATDVNDRLALVQAKDSKNAGAPGSNSAGKSDKASAALRQDLLRSQESLASLQQQSTELKTRLKDMADINSKNEHLLSLKDSEIADLQARLAAARKSAGLPAAAPKASTPSPAASAPNPALPEARMETATASTAAVATPAPAGSSVGTTATAAASSAARASTSAPTPAVVTPMPAKPAAKPVIEAAPAPVNEQPWYMQTWAWGAAAAAIVLLALLALLGRRKPAAGAKGPSSLADRFGSTAPADQNLVDGEDVDQDELLDQLAEHPDDIGLHLELVTLYYSRRDIEHFEAAAEAMHAHITDPQQDEWQDVMHMGEDLVPGHPLFDHHAELPVHDDAEARREFDIDDYADKSDAPTVVSTMPPLPPGTPKKVSEYNFNFDLTKTAGAESHPPVDDATVVAPLAAKAPAPETHAAPAAEKASRWNFDDAESAHPADGQGVEEFNDDPIDTKLDLARAYLDMGDADGARAMLGEVMKEGSQMQRDTAKRLLENLH